jgi:hypothetical protein
VRKLRESESLFPLVTENMAWMVKKAAKSKLLHKFVPQQHRGGGYVIQNWHNIVGKLKPAVIYVEVIASSPARGTE